jgi:GTP cyclohydrolase IA
MQRAASRARDARLWGFVADMGTLARRADTARNDQATGAFMTGVDPIGAPGAAGPMDPDRIRAAVRELLIGIGEDPDRDGLRDTPARIASSFAEIFSGLRADPADVLQTTFDLGHQEMVLVKDIPLRSMCEHHLLPFTGVAHVGYIPGDDGRITGLSALVRLVDVFARRPQVQERLTTQVADAMVDALAPQGVIVVVEAEHMCMSMRGVQTQGSTAVTSAVRGVMRDGATRAEAMSLVRGR